MEVDLSERRIRLEVGRVVSEAQEILLEVGVLGLADGGAEAERRGGREAEDGGIGTGVAVERRQAQQQWSIRENRVGVSE